MGPILATWTLLSGYAFSNFTDDRFGKVTFKTSEGEQVSRVSEWTVAIQYCITGNEVDDKSVRRKTNAHNVNQPDSTIPENIIREATQTAVMMTSSNGDIFRVTGHLCGEFTGPRCIPRIKASDAEL